VTAVTAAEVERKTMSYEDMVISNPQAEDM
jgi:hypothetical protein